jgi:hypothetical protein
MSQAMTEWQMRRDTGRGVTGNSRLAELYDSAHPPVYTDLALARGALEAGRIGLAVSRAAICTALPAPWLRRAPKRRGDGLKVAGVVGHGTHFSIR